MHAAKPFAKKVLRQVSNWSSQINALDSFLILCVLTLVLSSAAACWYLLYCSSVDILQPFCNSTLYQRLRGGLDLMRFRPCIAGVAARAVDSLSEPTMHML